VDTSAFIPRSSRIGTQKISGFPAGFPVRLSASEAETSELTDAEIEEMEIRKEAQMIAKKTRSNMYNENGVAYAPWMENQVDEEAYLAAKGIRAMRKKALKDEAVQQEGAFMSTDLQRDEIAGSGLSYKFIGDEVELSWSTTIETDNVGYKVEKRAARTDEWITVASYEDWAPLNSKGPNGGEYRFLDPTSQLGDWIYRVVDVDREGRNTLLCQVLVELQSEGEKNLQVGLAVGFVAVMGAFIAAGAIIDPIK